MDNGEGRFIAADTLDALRKKSQKGNNAPPDRERIFTVGEVVAIKGSRFRITHIKERGDMRLKLLPKE